MFSKTNENRPYLLRPECKNNILKWIYLKRIWMKHLFRILVTMSNTAIKDFSGISSRKTQQTQLSFELGDSASTNAISIEFMNMGSHHETSVTSWIPLNCTYLDKIEFYCNKSNCIPTGCLQTVVIYLPNVHQVSVHEVNFHAI